MIAPNFRNGSTIRFIGRRERDSSPTKVDANGNPARRPDIRRTVVPELPAFKARDAFCSPFKPRPSTVTVDPSRLIATPRSVKQSSVDWQSALSAKLWIVVLPSATAPIIASLWLMDLSPGTDAPPLILT